MANQKEIAQWLDLSDRQVRNLQNAGVLPKPRGRGVLDEKACVHAYINYLRAIGDNTSREEDESQLESNDDRLKRIRADTLEFKLQVEQSNFGLIGVLDSALEQVVGIIVPKLASIPAIIRMTSPDIRPSTIEKIQVEIAKVQNSIQAIEISLPDHDELDLSQCEAFTIALADDTAGVSS